MQLPRLVLACLLAWSGLAASAQERETPLQLDIREAIVRVPSRVKDAFGKESAGEQLVTTFRPAGPGPFPLAIISHGRSSDKRAEYKRQRFESAARFFVRKGFAVAVPLRLGYGELAALGDPEENVNCNRPSYGSAITAAAQEILDVAQFMSGQADIDARRIVLVGVSVGGISTIAATSVHLPGEVAAINFAGGHGGNPEQHPGEPCQPELLRRLYGAWGAANAKTLPATPSLWIYAENDHYFAPKYAKRWAEAYVSAGGAADLRVLPAYGEDGHKLFSTGNDVWQPLVDAFLKQQGFEHAGQVIAPAPVGPLPEESAVPAQQRAVLKKFLALKPPRALALSDDGSWGYARGDDALSKALAYCQRNQAMGVGSSCHLYAVDEAVVWSAHP